MDQAPRRDRCLTPQRATRRRFLAGLTSMAAALGRSPARAAARAVPETVLVVGAGLAGLVAAFRLKEAGKRVILIEASDRAGGRVRTLRGHFDDGLYAELGAARIAESHTYALHWLNELGLNLTPFAPPGPGIQVLNGRPVLANDEAARVRFAPDLKADERALSSGLLLAKYIEGVPAELGEGEVDLAQPRWRAFDRVTWPAWLRERGASRGAIQLMTLGGDSSSFSALFLLQQIMLHRDLRQYLKIEGGMDRLPLGIAAALAGELRTGCELIRLEQTATGVRAICRQEGRTDVIPASRAVLAVPFSTLRRVIFDPVFSPAKTRILNEMHYYEATRFLLQTRTRFWQAARQTGGARTGTSDIWDMSFGQPGRRGLISLTTGNAELERRLAAMNAGARLAFGTGLAAEAFPTIAAAVEKSHVQRWMDEPFARGAFVVFRPGQMTAWAPSLSRPEGRVHFAGEHTSPWNGWMEGAVWSGEHVAQELLQQ
jgi:monoamine oxidase